MPKRIKDQNTYIHGSHNEICDVCGFKFKTEDMHTRWDGLRTCHDDFEERHPMDFFRAFPDDQNVNDPDADDTDNSGVNTVAPSTNGPIPDQSNFNGQTITPLDVSAFFVEGNGTNVKYVATKLPAGLVIDSTTGIISGTVNSIASNSSPYPVTITLTTSYSAVFSVSLSFSWEITVSYAELILSTASIISVEGYWKFDTEAGLTVTDFSGNSRDMTRPVAFPLAAGKVNQAIDFPGGSQNGNDCVGGPFTGWPANFLDDFTIEAWVNFTAAPITFASILNVNGVGNVIGLNVEVNTSTTTTDPLTVLVQSTATLTFADILTVGAWHHVVATYDRTSNVTTLYIDGASAGTGAASNPVDAQTSVMSGKRATGNIPALDGLVDELVLYRGVMSLADVQAHYNAGLAL